MAAAWLALLAATACEYGEKSTGTGTPRVVVHAVLNPDAGSAEYVVLVERTLSGRIDTHSEVRDPAGTLRVSQTLPPMRLPAPMTVSPPRMVAPA